MKKYIFSAFVLGLTLLFLQPPSVIGGRGRGGGGGGGGRGGGGGSFGGSRPSGGGGVVQSYGGGGGGRQVASRPAAPVVGPSGGGQGARGGGSYTTKGGSTIDYKGGAAGGSTPGGAQGGKYVGGIQVTTPGGKEATKVGSGGAVAGPGGNAAGSKSSTTVGSGPQGSAISKSQGGAVIGPQGGAAGKSQVGAATGPGGGAVGGSRGAVANGPYGAAAGRVGAAAGTRGGTAYRSTAAIRGQGAAVRQAVNNYPCFRPGWYTQHPGAWFAAGWAANSVWRAATWGTCSSYCGAAEDAAYYNYGENVVYQEDGVYMDGAKAYSTEEYAQQASDLATAGRDAKATKEEEWLPLGVFAMVQGDEKVSNHIFQLSVNKQGVMRGNYYDAVTDNTSLVYGSVDPKTQRAAWTVGDRKTPIYEAGFANLTENETTMMVHYGTERSQQYTLIRVEEPAQADQEKK